MKYQNLIFLRAAERIYEGKDDHACIAIEQSIKEIFVNKKTIKIAGDFFNQEFADLFMPDNCRIDEPWFREVDNNWFWVSQDGAEGMPSRNHHRIMALLFMNEIYAGGKL